MINPGAIDQIREKLDIVELVREYVPGLRRAGRTWKACCPFHQERTASFTVSQDKQLWYCFGACHQGGDLFKFLMKIENLSFGEAAQRLADRAGVQWKPSAESLGPRERERLEAREALEFAKDFYRKVLESSPEADGARRYLAGRGVSAESREKFELGFALPDGTSLLDAAVRKGFKPQTLVKAGVIIEREGGRYRDYFRTRVLFPIRDSRGSVVGFGGRTLGDSEPKYLNTPETAVFAKGRTLYALWQAGPSIRKDGKAVLVEGYMDAIACHQHGLGRAVAPLGTSLTPDHAQLLKRYAEEALVVFDADRAGMQAAVRGAELLLEAGLAVRIGSVPEGKDPDEFLKAKGAKALLEALAKSADVAQFKTELLLRDTPPRSIEDKVRLARAVLETVDKQPSDVIRHEWTKRLAERLGVDEAALKSESRKLSRARNKERNLEQAAVSNELEPERAERDLLQLLLKHPALLKSASDLKPEDFLTERAKEAWRRMAAAAAEGPGWPERLARSAEEGWLARLLLEDREFPAPEESLQQLLADFRRAGRDESRFKELQAEVVAMIEGKKPMRAEVLAEYRELQSKLKGTHAAPH